MSLIDRMHWSKVNYNRFNFTARVKSLAHSPPTQLTTGARHSDRILYFHRARAFARYRVSSTHCAQRLLITGTPVENDFVNAANEYRTAYRFTS